MASLLRALPIRPPSGCLPPPESTRSASPARPRVLRQVDRLDVAAARLARLDAHGCMRVALVDRQLARLLLAAGGAAGAVELPLQAAQRAVQHAHGRLGGVRNLAPRADHRRAA